MDSQTDDGGTDGKINRHTDGQIDKQTDIWIDRWMGRQIDG
jgi:hypothetical protein